MNGALLFVRYAWPPNTLGYCGPDDSEAVAGHAVAGVDDEELRRLLHEFEGAWPYLELIAECNGVGDPLDARVVEAYWLGNALLDRVPLARFAASVDDRFRRRAGDRRWSALAGALAPGARPHHSFHVFAVFPWIGLLRGGAVDEPLRVLDRCRIRAGTVVDVAGDTVIVRTRALAWDGARLAEGTEHVDTASWPAFLAPAIAGDRVALHWDWVCDRVNDAQVRNLERVTASTIALVNRAACGTAARVPSRHRG